MKIRNFVLLIICILFSTFLMFLVTDKQPSINQFVIGTQAKLNDWKTSKVAEKVPSPVDKYLVELGFVDNPVLYPEQKWSHTTLPVVVSAISSKDINFVYTFIKSLQIHLPDHLLVLYELGLKSYDISKVSALCNSTNCYFRHFDFNLYPSHVEDLKFSAFRPIIIQKVLCQAGAVLWLDIRYVFSSRKIQGALATSEKEGLVAWSINHPTSSLTHPHMFDNFHTSQDNFYFHRMVEPNHVIIYNTRKIHDGLMEPWVRCALVLDCIAPIGAQSSGCRFDKKPLYRYSGCHRYDMSAFNVALGILFDFSASRYSGREEDKFFHPRKSDTESLALDKDNVKNFTNMFFTVPNNV